MTETIKILFVDDERNVLRSIERLFLDEDYEILTAESGAEGLQMLSGGQPVQIVVADFRMPEMNGVDFLRQVYARWTVDGSNPSGVSVSRTVRKWLFRCGTKVRRKA